MRTVQVLIATLTGMTVLTCARGEKRPTGAGGERPQYRVVTKRLGRLPRAVAPPVFSDDGCHVACVVRTARGMSVFVDGKEGPAYEGIGKGSLVFSPDGKRLAYTTKKGKKRLVAVDGKEGPAYDGILKGSLVFSPDGKRLAYTPKKGQKWLAIVDGKEGPAYDGIGEGTPVFSPDGKRLA